jgi:predicted porin
MEIYRMKKSLLAVAAMGAFASAAQAQSSVTVYGILDMGYIGSNAREVAAGTLGGAGGAVTKITKNAIGASAEQTNRLGFKGTEDLGGGTSAFFTVELGLQPQNGNLSGTDPYDGVQNTSQAGGSAIDNRQSFVGLKKNGIGQVALGRQYTPIFNAGAVTDPGQYNNVAGNVIYNSGSVGTSSTATGGSGFQNNISFTNRASNAVTFKTDNFAGFTASGLFAANQSNRTEANGTANATTSTLTQGNNNWGGWGLSADYTWQKLYVTAAYQSFRQSISGTIAATTAGVVNVNGAAPNNAFSVLNQTLYPSSLSDKQTYAGATYDFGILKAYVQWVGRKVQQDSAQASNLNTVGGAYTAITQSGAQMNRNAQQLGVRSYITPAIEAWASIGTGKFKGPNLSATQEAASVNFLAWQLGSNYYLSKRTNLYAIYGQQQSTSGSSGVVGSGNSANQYAVGVRHTF